MVFFMYDSKLNIAIISKSRVVLIKLTNKTNFRAIQSCVTIILTPCPVPPIPKQPCPPYPSAKRHYYSVQGVTLLRASHHGVLSAQLRKPSAQSNVLHVIDSINGRYRTKILLLTEEVLGSELVWHLFYKPLSGLITRLTISGILVIRPDDD